MFAKFFIDRPRFAMVISILLALAGIIGAFSLPVEQYPNVTPPQVQVEANYRGAAADVVANTVGAPLEELINKPTLAFIPYLQTSAKLPP